MNKYDTSLKIKYIIPHGEPHAKATGSGSWFIFFWVGYATSPGVSFIDGFNLYHAIHNLKRPELKWLNLRALSQVFLKSYSETLIQVLYFSAYAEHMPESTQKKQKAYVKALELNGVRPILGHFKTKNRKCPECHYKWSGHEEKQTDVNIALFLIDLAYQNEFGRALVISNDSDLVPAIQMLRRRFPEKRVTTIVPPLYKHSNELIQVSSDKSKVRIEHLERCLLPSVVSDPSGLVWVSRPHEYTPTKGAYHRNLAPEKI